ncbi:MAG: beta-propeller domain-containing protein, partial [Eubacteriales bacterium]
MKKEDKEILSKLKDKLKDFDVSNPLPLELSKENITEVLKQQPAPSKKQGKLIEIRYLASIAAAIIIIVGAVTAFNIFDGSSRIRIAIDSINGNATSTQSTENSTKNNNVVTLNPNEKPDKNGTANTTITQVTLKPPVKPTKDVLKAAGITSPKSYNEIFALFKKMSKDVSRVTYTTTGDFALGAEKSVAADAAPSTNGSTTTNATAQDSTYGETNVQVKGIDEPDVMKNDGKYLYTVNSGNEINIFSLLPADNMKLTSTIKFVEKEGKSEYANALFVKGNLLVVFSNMNTYRVFEETTTVPNETKPDVTAVTGSSGGSSSEPSKTDDTTDAATPDSKMIAPYPGYYYSKNESVCTIYDISNKAAPKEIKKISQDGSYISARLIGSELYILTSYYVDLYMKDNLEDICIPAISIDGKSKTIPAEDINIAKAPEPSYLVVCGLNLSDLNAEPDTKAVLGGGAEAYCTKDSLFASRTVYAGGNQLPGGDVAVNSSDNSYSTEIFRFAIGGGKVEFKNSGKVSGSILNQFSMDEYNGYFRIATTQGDWGKTSSNVFVLNDKFDVVGKIENIAPKEQIYAVRFTGETGYVVSFEQKDPLFVLDLSNPVAPKITGKLILPGFSSYLQPVSDTLLLGIGQNGDDKGTLPGIKLSLFNVSDPENPKEVDKYIIEGDSYSEAMYNHKALMIYPEKALFGLPVVKYNYQPVVDSSTSSGTASSEIAYNNGMVSTFNTYTVKDNKPRYQGRHLQQH